LRLTGRDEHKLKTIEAYLKENNLWRDPKEPINFTGESLELDLSTVEACISGPKRPHDRVAISD